jgi:excisionase family DNA binding protein
MHPQEHKKRQAADRVPETVTADRVSAIPFRDRPTCRIDEACQVSGLGRSSLYAAMKDGRLEFSKVGKRTLISVPSLLLLIGAAPASA